MREACAVALSLLVLFGAVAVAAPASAASPSESPGAIGPMDVQVENNSSMGGQVSSFMHSSSGQTGEEVESGMWNAAYENASNRSAVVDDRTSDIQSRLEALKMEKRELVEARNDGRIDRAEFQARMSGIVGRLTALNQSIDETERQAHAVGADTSGVAALRDEASNVTGPEVAASARSLPGGPPEGGPAAANDGGPPNETGPPNGTQGPPGNGNGQGPPGNDSNQGSSKNGPG